MGQEHDVIRIVQNARDRQQDGTGESTGREGSQEEGTGKSTSGDPIYGPGCLCRPGAGLSGARQAEGRQPRSRCAPQNSDHSASDFVLFRVGKVV